MIFAFESEQIGGFTRVQPLKRHLLLCIVVIPPFDDLPIPVYLDLHCWVPKAYVELHPATASASEASPIRLQGGQKVVRQHSTVPMCHMLPLWIWFNGDKLTLSLRTVGLNQQSALQLCPTLKQSGYHQGQWPSLHFLLHQRSTYTVILSVSLLNYLSSHLWLSVSETISSVQFSVQLESLVSSQFSGI